MSKFTGGIVIALISVLIGEFSGILEALIILMVLDYILGVLCAITGNSNKTKDGRLSSQAGFIGIIRKAVMFMVIIVAYQLEKVSGVSEVRNIVIISFIANECLSILENAVNMGVPVPPVLKRVISSLDEEG